MESNKASHLHSTYLYELAYLILTELNETGTIILNLQVRKQKQSNFLQSYVQEIDNLRTQTMWLRLHPLDSHALLSLRMESDFTRTLWILIFTAHQQLRGQLQSDVSTLIPASARTLPGLTVGQLLGPSTSREQACGRHGPRER